MSWASPGSLDSQVHHGLVKGELVGRKGTRSSRPGRVPREGRSLSLLEERGVLRVRPGFVVMPGFEEGRWLSGDRDVKHSFRAEWTGQLPLASSSQQQRTSVLFRQHGARFPRLPIAQREENTCSLTHHCKRHPADLLPRKAVWSLHGGFVILLGSYEMTRKGCLSLTVK